MPNREATLVRDTQDQEFFSPLQEGERRAGLRRLDDLLSALEELNMREAGELPQALREKLLVEGIPVHTGSTATDLLDMVLSSQEQYMLKERRTGRRRRRLSYIPTDAELVSAVSRRLSA
jgi:hypothetical protein